jgi:hypothetical protein
MSAVSASVIYIPLDIICPWERIKSHSQAFLTTAKTYLELIHTCSVHGSHIKSCYEFWMEIEVWMLLKFLSGKGHCYAIAF